MLSHTLCAGVQGIRSHLVRVEVDVQPRGLPGWTMVGLLETAVREARERVESALRNSGFTVGRRRTTINLAPGNVKKVGVHFDLPIAVGLLTAWDICRPPPDRQYLLAGELSLSGKLLPVRGALLMALAAREHQLTGIIVPATNAAEAKLVEGLDVVGLETLVDVIDFLNDGRRPAATHETLHMTPVAPVHDFSEVRGQAAIKRALEIAAVGHHNILMIGPPGSGKTMLAERLPGILPALTLEEKLETMKVYSLQGQLTPTFIASNLRPFRAPHHSASYAGLVGGGHAASQLGEISLAHNGVLFLDEFPEFRRDALEVLRQPLESGEVRIVRAGHAFTYPARFMLVAAMNPCPCGYLDHPRKACTCSTHSLSSYRRKLSGPLLDRIDMHVRVEPLPHAELMEESTVERSADIRERVLRAREFLQKRTDQRASCNALIPARDLRKLCPLADDARALLHVAVDRLQLSARAVHRILRIARSIADLDAHMHILKSHVAEALQYRASENTPA